jgi:hypothetical protein
MIKISRNHDQKIWEQPMGEDSRYRDLRKALQSANEAFSYKLIHELLKRSGFKLSIDHDSLAKFGAGLTKKFSNSEDLNALEQFFHVTEVGRILRKETVNTSAFYNIIASLNVRIPSKLINRIDGRYFCFHGSVTKNSRFTVRLLTIKRQSNAIVEINSKMLIDRDSENINYFESNGFLSYDKYEFQILMFHKHDENEKSDLLGLNLIVFEDNNVEPRFGPVTIGYAPMIGLAQKGRFFVRRLAIKRIPGDITEQDALKRTGDYEKDELSKEFLEEFESLASRFPAEQIVDPVLSLSVA